MYRFILLINKCPPWSPLNDSKYTEAWRGLRKNECSGDRIHIIVYGDEILYVEVLWTR